MQQWYRSSYVFRVDLHCWRMVLSMKDRAKCTVTIFIDSFCCNKFSSAAIYRAVVDWTNLAVALIHLTWFIDLVFVRSDQLQCLLKFYRYTKLLLTAICEATMHFYFVYTILLNHKIQVGRDGCMCKDHIQSRLSYFSISLLTAGPLVVLPFNSVLSTFHNECLKNIDPVKHYDSWLFF